MMPKDLSIIPEANEGIENKSTTLNPDMVKQHMRALEEDQFSQLELNDTELNYQRTNLSKINQQMGGADVSNIRPRDPSNFMDDSKLLEYLEPNNDGVQEVDMGQIDEEDRPFLIFDQDSGKYYDIRNEETLTRLTDNVTTRFTSETDKSMSKNVWDDWWKEKRHHE